MISTESVDDIKEDSSFPCKVINLFILKRKISYGSNLHIQNNNI